MSDLLKEISLALVRIVIPVIICTSIIGNTLNIAVLGRYKMRKHSCSLYLIALSTNNLLYSLTILVISLLVDGYQIRISLKSFILCKLIAYFGTLLSALSPTFIVLASIDQWYSSLNIQRDRFRNIQTSKYLIFITTLFFSILFIISLVKTELNTDGTLLCRMGGDQMFVQIYGIFQFIFFSIVAPCLMLGFGCLTICNIQKHQVATAASSSHRRIENQIVRMLFCQVGAQLFFSLPLCVANLLLSFPNIYQPLPYFYSIYIICRVVFHISNATPFFLYFLSARIFRKEWIKLMSRISQFHGQNRVHVMRRNNVSNDLHRNRNMTEAYF